MGLNFWREQGFVPLELAHRPRWHEFMLADPPLTSEMTFTNMFIWRHAYAPVWRIARDCLQVVALTSHEKPQPFGLPPLGPGDKAASFKDMLHLLEQAGPEPEIRRVSEDMLRKHLNPGRQQAILDQAQSDYVYLAKDLIQLKGNRLHRKKNHLNRFLRTADYEYLPLQPGLIPEVKDAQIRWLGNREEDILLAGEHRAVMEALDHFGCLDYIGGVIKVGGQVEAFSLGEPLSPDTAVIHIEKANVEIPGLYAAINQMFCQNAWSDYSYINREQDLGLEGLRAAKESYLPHHLVHKYIIRPCPTGAASGRSA